MGSSNRQKSMNGSWSKRGDTFSLYQYPWAKPSVTYNAKFVDKGYENVSVMDWDFQGYPYLAVKYQAQGIMSTDFLVKLVNLYSRNETVIKDFNTDFSIQSSGNFYAANTSYTYQPVPGNVSRPSADEAQKVFRLISKSTGKRIGFCKTNLQRGRCHFRLGYGGR
ncbi:hypothetical protein ACFTAO_44925 [Paenibacillus rhizoplanae]